MNRGVSFHHGAPPANLHFLSPPPQLLRYSTVVPYSGQSGSIHCFPSPGRSPESVYGMKQIDSCLILGARKRHLYSTISIRSITSGALAWCDAGVLIYNPTQDSGNVDGVVVGQMGQEPRSASAVSTDGDSVRLGEVGELCTSRPSRTIGYPGRKLCDRPATQSTPVPFNHTTNRRPALAKSSSIKDELCTSPGVVVPT